MIRERPIRNISVGYGQILAVYCSEPTSAMEFMAPSKDGEDDLDSLPERDEFPGEKFGEKVRAHFKERRDRY